MADKPKQNGDGELTDEQLEDLFKDKLGDPDKLTPEEEERVKRATDKAKEKLQK